MENAFSKSTDAVLAQLGVNPSTGLTDEQVAQQRAKHGKNGMYIPPV
jgi:Ca2+ transporting ATPase